MPPHPRSAVEVADRADLLLMGAAVKLKRDRASVGSGWRILLAIVPLVAAVAGACGTSSSVTTDPSPVKCQLSLSNPSSVDAAGGRGVFTVTTQPECAWDASTTTDWISGLSPASGQGTKNVEFQVAPNDGGASREGDILVKDSRVHVSQRAPCRIELTPPSQIVGENGGAGSLSVATAGDCPWTAASGVSWISLTPPATGTGNGSVGFTVSPNSLAERVGAITVAGQVSLVTQAGSTPPQSPTPSCTYAISGSSQNVGAAGGAGTPVTVSTQNGCQWAAASNAPWISLTSVTAGTGNGSVAFNVAPNTGAARVGTLTIASQTLTVSQAPCVYSINPTNQSVGSALTVGTPVTVATLSSCQWSARSNVSWLIITSATSGTGNGSVAFSVVANTGPARTGTLTIAGQTETITQDAPCMYSISPREQVIGSSGGSGIIDLVTQVGCQSTARSTVAWITVQSGVTNVGSSRISYNVEANFGAARVGSIEIADQTLTVTQNGSGQ
ncbi:MAG TPA: BACON domain-containing protein [Vicinamibacterales bacterium]